MNHVIKLQSEWKASGERVDPFIAGHNKQVITVRVFN